MSCFQFAELKVDELKDVGIHCREPLLRHIRFQSGIKLRYKLRQPANFKKSQNV